MMAKVLSHLLQFLLAVVLTVQSSAYALEGYTKDSIEVTQALLEAYNSLTSPQRRTQVLKWLDARTSSDADFLERYKEDLSLIMWPELHHDGVRFSFELEGKTVSFSTRENKISVKGRSVDLRPGKLIEATRKLEQMLSEKSFSVLDILIPDAHAGGPVLLLALVAIAFAAVVLAPALSYVNLTIAKIKCRQIRSNLITREGTHLTPSEASDLRSSVNRILSETESALAGAECDQEPGLCRELRHNKECFSFVQAEVSERFGEEGNDASRINGIKEFFFGDVPKAKLNRVREQ